MVGNLKGDYKAEEQLALRASKASEVFLRKHAKPTHGEKAIQGALEPLAQALGKQKTHAKNIVDKVTKFMDNHNPVDVIDNFGKLATHAEKHMSMLFDPGKWTLEGMEDVGGPLVESLMSASMGINLGAGASRESGADAHQADQAIRTIKRVTGFCIIFPLASAGAISILKMATHNHTPDAVQNTIGSMGEQLGLNWLLGNLFETVFETAVGQPLNELINTQTHPARLEMPILNRLARQHKFKDPAEFVRALNALGYRSEDIELIKKLDENQLSMADVQLAVLNGAMGEGDVDRYLQGAGFSERDAKVLKTIYVDKAETTGDTAYRQAALADFKAGHLTESQLRAVLEQVHTPKQSIDHFIAAAKLEEELRDRHLALGTLKQMHQRKEITDSAVHTELEAQGYSSKQVADLLTLWKSENKPKVRAIPASTILRYSAQKVLTEPEAISKLQSYGYSATDAAFMVRHPTTHHSTRQDAATPPQVLAAYKHGVINHPTAQQKLIDLGVSSAQALLELQIADKEMVPRRKHPPGSATLTPAQILEAVTLDLRDPTWAYDQYIALGYDEADANLLMTMAIAKTTPTPAAPTGQGGGLTSA